jgi:hypothetical protein
VFELPPPKVGSLHSPKGERSKENWHGFPYFLLPPQTTVTLFWRGSKITADARATAGRGPKNE